MSARRREESPPPVEEEGKSYDFVNAAPPPDTKQRELIFDSLSKIVGTTPDRRSGRSKGHGDNRGTYIATWGAGYHGQLGRKFIRGQKKYSAIPMHIEMDCVVRQVTCGGLHTAVVTEGGDVYTWGDGRKGQLGHTHDPSLKQTPRLVVALENVYVVQVACGGDHTVAITDTGVMYAWGWSKHGQTGHGDRQINKIPKRIDHDNAKEIVAISAGNKHTVAINKRGEPISFGCGEHGQTGHGDSVDRIVPTKIESLMQQGVTVKSIACGSIHTCFVTNKGEVYLCGFGEYFHPNESQHFFYDPKQIEMPEPIVQVSCGQSHNLALTSNGDVYTWGSGEYGQLGYGIFGNLSTPRLVLNQKGIASVAAGRYHSFALSNMGVLYSWGCGENGQLGQDSDENIALPTVVQPILGSVIGQVACGEHHSAVLSSAPWTKLSVTMQEWLLESKVEQELKLKYLKKTHRGLTRKDLSRIHEEMKKWGEMHEQRKKELALEEEEELARDVKAIHFDGTLDNEVEDRSKTMKLPSVNDRDSRQPANEMDDDLAEKKGAGGAVRLPKVHKKKGSMTERKTKTVAMSGPYGGTPEPFARETTAQAPLTRTMFLKETAQMVSRMKAVVQDKGESESNRHLQQMMRLVFEFRKEYDQLKNQSRNLTKKVEDAKREHALLVRSSDLSKESHADMSEKLKDLEMQLNTVTIKIMETSENRKNYEMNIAHLKEEDFEHFNQLKSLRKQNHDNNNFFKKMNELKAQALQEKEKAEQELAEFKAEINNYQKFVYQQLEQFEQILDIVRSQNDNREEAKGQRADRIEARINLRIDKLKAEAELAEKESGGLSARLTSLDLKLRHFEDSFQKITAATGLTNPDAIVNKFFFKGEIKEQLETEIEDKQAQIDKLRKEEGELKNGLAYARNNFRDQTWRDVDIMTENSRETGFKENRSKEEMDRVNARLAFVQEGLLTIFKQVMGASGSPADGEEDLDSASLWEPEQTDRLFKKLLPQVDELIVAERAMKKKEEEEAASRKKIQEDFAKAADGAGGAVLSAFGVASIATDATPAATEDGEGGAEEEEEVN